MEVKASWKGNSTDSSQGTYHPSDDSFWDVGEGASPRKASRWCVHHFQRWAFYLRDWWEVWDALEHDFMLTFSADIFDITISQGETFQCHNRWADTAILTTAYWQLTPKSCIHIKFKIWYECDFIWFHGSICLQTGWFILNIFTVQFLKYLQIPKHIIKTADVCRGREKWFKA